MSITMLKKLGAKQILANVKKITTDFCAKDGDSVDAYTIYGVCDGIKTGTSNYGEWTAFLGNMEAINHATGEMFAAMQCFIPEPLQTIIKTALTDHDQVEFAFTVKVKRRDDLKEGYEYLVVPHKQATEANPLEKLRGLVPSIPKLSLAPPAEVTEEAKPAATVSKSKKG